MLKSRIEFNRAACGEEYASATRIRNLMGSEEDPDTLATLLPDSGYFRKIGSILISASSSAKQDSESAVIRGIGSAITPPHFPEEPVFPAKGLASAYRSPCPDASLPTAAIRCAGIRIGTNPPRKRNGKPIATKTAISTRRESRFSPRRPFTSTAIAPTRPSDMAKPSWKRRSHPGNEIPWKNRRGALREQGGDPGSFLRLRPSHQVLVLAKQERPGFPIWRPGNGNEEGGAGQIGNRQGGFG